MHFVLIEFMVISFDKESFTLLLLKDKSPDFVMYEFFDRTVVDTLRVNAERNFSTLLISIILLLNLRWPSINYHNTCNNKRIALYLTDLY